MLQERRMQKAKRLRLENPFDKRFGKARNVLVGTFNSPCPLIAAIIILILHENPLESVERIRVEKIPIDDTIRPWL